jgi:hypothetical protein
MKPNGNEIRAPTAMIARNLLQKNLVIFFIFIPPLVDVCVFDFCGAS